jgi:hypothetical protein
VRAVSWEDDFIEDWDGENEPWSEEEFDDEE